MKVYNCHRVNRCFEWVRAHSKCLPGLAGSRGVNKIDRLQIVVGPASTCQKVDVMKLDVLAIRCYYDTFVLFPLYKSLPSCCSALNLWTAWVDGSLDLRRLHSSLALFALLWVFRWVGGMSRVGVAHASLLVRHGVSITRA